MNRIRWTTAILAVSLAAAAGCKQSETSTRAPGIDPSRTSSYTAPPVSTLNGGTGLPMAPGSYLPPGTPGASQALPFIPPPPRQGPPGIWAGAAGLDLQPPVGASLAGFGQKPRRNPVTLASFFTILGSLSQGSLKGPIQFYDPNPNDWVTLFEPSQGVLDPITAKCLVLDDGKQRVAFFKIDAIATPSEVTSALDLTAAQLGIPYGNLIVSATHTHSGPGGLTRRQFWELAAADAYQQRLSDILIARMRIVLTEAVRKLEPARVGVTSIQAPGLSGIRGKTPTASKPDETMGVIRVEDRNGKPLAVLFNFAVHGVCYGRSNMFFSADCMGEAERYLEGQLGLGSVAIFTNGAEGDVSPIQKGASGAALVGKGMGDAVLAALPGAVMKQDPIIKGARHVERFPEPFVRVTNTAVNGAVTLPFGITLPKFSFKILKMDELWMPRDLPFGAIRIDDVVFASVPGEPITNLGLEIKAAGKAEGFREAFVIGLANEHASYFTTQQQYDTSDYHGMASFFGRDNGVMLVNNARRAIQLVK